MVARFGPRILRTLLGGCVLLGCGGHEATSGLRISTEGDTTEYRATWEYSSFEVDVVLSLVTAVSAEACSSSATLSVNDVVSATDRYELAPTECNVLLLDETGDIVMSEQPTSHDWTSEELAVDTGREVMTLGPTDVLSPETGESVTYRFTLSNPPCADDADCKCAALDRFGGEARLTLPLGRKCD
jgi:hypothetical protein